MNKKIGYAYVLDNFTDNAITYKEITFMLLSLFFIVFFTLYGFVSFIFDFIWFFS